MPHCELHYSDDLDFDAEVVLEKVEQVVKAHDSGALGCKGRAYPAPIYRYTHLKVTLYLISKPHRDKLFTEALMADLEAQTKALLPQSCFFSLAVEYSTAYYMTNEHTV